MIRIAVCDDDNVFIEKKLKPLLYRAQKAVGVMTKVKFFTDGRLLLDEFKQHENYSIVILDIDMPSINGKELAARLRELDKELYIAFMSAYKEEVYDVISLNISAFIPKEYDQSRCLEELTKLLRKYAGEKSDQKLFGVLSNGKSAVVKLCPDNILFIKSIKGVVMINTMTETLTSTDRSLKKIESELSESGFYKIRSNILVNVNKVYEVLDSQIILNNGTRLPVSRRRRKELLEILSKIISEKVVT